jgi:hypothetical protein
MANNNPHFRICTYNCRSMKNSLHDIRKLCDTHDFVCKSTGFYQMNSDCLQILIVTFMALVTVQLIFVVIFLLVDLMEALPFFIENRLLM